MAKHKLKDAWFELPEDISQRQAETYEAEAKKILDDAKEKTDSVLARAAIDAAFKAGFLTAGEGVPQKAGEARDFPSNKVIFWMGSNIALFLQSLKVPDPN